MKIIEVCGLRSGVGTSFIAASLAYRFSVTETKVLVASSCAHTLPLELYFNAPLDVNDGWASQGAALQYRLHYTDELDVLPRGEVTGLSEEELTEKLSDVIREAQSLYDIVVIDAGVRDEALPLRSHCRLTVLEPEAGCLMRLVDLDDLPGHEALVFNKVLPLSRTQRDVMSFLHTRPQWLAHLVPYSIPHDEFALQSTLFKQPVTQTMLFTQSAEQINQLATWTKQQLLG